MKTANLRRVVCSGFMLIGFALLTGCHTLPMEQYSEFTPLAPHKRIMNEVKVTWETRDDVAQICSKAIGMSKDAAYLTPPLACAFWDKTAKQCSIITGKTTNHAVIGHELRHCFEGHFH
jgi:hypothetical protein